MLALGGALAQGEPLPAREELLVNDLQQPAISLCPGIADALEEARRAGAAIALLSGSGPTVLGLFPDREDPPASGYELAARAAERLAERVPAPAAARPVQADFGLPVPALADPGG
jgi:4-diphosphocytidyl-2-C-methyl-D-erythritol kinase